MKRLVLCAAFALTVFAPAANAASCGEEMDALMKAISGHLTMSRISPECLVSPAMQWS